jgi:hypothetical protein
MKELNRIPAEELFITEIGIGGNPIPTNGPGRRYPVLKYFIVGGLVVGVFTLAYYIHKQRTPKIIAKKDEKRTRKHK